MRCRGASCHALRVRRPADHHVQLCPTILGLLMSSPIPLLKVGGSECEILEGWPRHARTCGGPLVLFSHRQRRSQVRNAVFGGPRSTPGPVLRRTIANEREYHLSYVLCSLLSGAQPRHVLPLDHHALNPRPCLYLSAKGGRSCAPQTFGTSMTSSIEPRTQHVAAGR